MRISVSQYSKCGAIRRPRLITAGALLSATAALCLLAFSLTGCSFGASTSNKSDVASLDGQVTDTAVAPGTVKPKEESDEAKTEFRSENTTTLAKAKEAVQKVIEQYGTDVSVTVMPLASSGNSSGEVTVEGDDPYDMSKAVHTSSSTSSSWFDINGSEKFTADSMIKLLVLAEFMNQLDQGTIKLTDTYKLSKDDVVEGSGTLATAVEDTTYTYDDLARYMICNSDDTATNVLIDILGMDNINKKATELGFTQTVLNRKMKDTETDLENYITANDAAIILELIANRTLASAQVCETAEGYLKAQTDKAGLLDGLPAGTTFAHLACSLEGARYDAGIVYANTGYATGIGTSSSGSGSSSESGSDSGSSESSSGSASGSGSDSGASGSASGSSSGIGSASGSSSGSGSASGSSSSSSSTSKSKDSSSSASSSTSGSSSATSSADSTEAQSFVVAVLTKVGEGSSIANADDANKLMAEISKTLYDVLKG